MSLYHQLQMMFAFVGCPGDQMFKSVEYTTEIYPTHQGFDIIHDGWKAVDATPLGCDPIFSHEDSGWSITRQMKLTLEADLWQRDVSHDKILPSAVNRTRGGPGVLVRRQPRHVAPGPICPRPENILAGIPITAQWRGLEVRFRQPCRQYTKTLIHSTQSSKSRLRRTIAPSNEVHEFCYVRRMPEICPRSKSAT